MLSQADEEGRKSDACPVSEEILNHPGLVLLAFASLQGGEPQASSFFAGGKRGLAPLYWPLQVLQSSALMSGSGPPVGR